MKQLLIKEDTSKRITSLRYILSVLVVFIHNDFQKSKVIEDISKGIKPSSFAFQPNLFTEFIQFSISNCLSLCAVPLFFMIAAYLQQKKNDDYPTLLKKKSKTLLIPFFLWTIINIFLINFVKLFISKIFPSFLARPGEIPIFSWTYKHWFSSFFGDYFNIGINAFHTPYAGQLWFVRDLFILICLSPIIKKLIKKVPIETFVLVVFINICNIQPVFVQSNALLFYTLGLFWAEYDFDLFAFSDNCNYKVLLPLYFILILTAFLLQKNNTISFNFGAFITVINITLSILVMCKLSNYLCSKEKIFHITKYLSTFSFFLYAMHMPFVIDSLQMIWLKIFPMKNAFFCLFEYFGVTIIDILICTVFGMLLKKICPKVFAILNGGRG